MGGKLKVLNVNIIKPKSWIESEINDLENYLATISSLNLIKDSKFNLYLYVSGGNTKSVYTEVGRRSGNKILSRHFHGPPFMKLLRWLIAAEGGLVQITDSHELKQSIEKLAYMSYVEIIYLPQEFHEELISYCGDWKKSVVNFLEDKPSYIYIMIDADNFESASGIYSAVCYNDNTDGKLKIFYEKLKDYFSSEN